MKNNSFLIFSAAFLMATLSTGCAAPLVFAVATAVPVAGMIYFSDADEEEIKGHLSKNFNVDPSQIEISDVEKEPHLFGLSGNTYYFDVTVSPMLDRYRCQVDWSWYGKPPPRCSEGGTSSVTTSSNRGLANIGNASSASSYSADRRLLRDTQMALNSLGYDAGPEDGLMGPRTANALQAFQRDQGFDVSGTVDQVTWEALRNATTPIQQ